MLTHYITIFDFQSRFHESLRTCVRIMICSFFCSIEQVFHASCFKILKISVWHSLPSTVLVVVTLETRWSNGYHSVHANFHSGFTLWHFPLWWSLPCAFLIYLYMEPASQFTCSFEVLGFPIYSAMGQPCTIGPLTLLYHYLLSCQGGGRWYPSHVVGWVNSSPPIGGVGVAVALSGLADTG